MVKNPPAMQETLSLISGLGRSPGRVHGNPLQYSCLKSSHGQRSLARYNPRGHNESNTTEGLSTTIIDTADLNLPFCYLFPVLIPFLFLFSFGLNVFSKILVFEPICFLAIFFLYFQWLLQSCIFNLQPMQNQHHVTLCKMQDPYNKWVHVAFSHTLCYCHDALYFFCKL